MFRPKLSPGKKTGDLKDRNVPLSTAVNQNMAGGGRYGVNECLKEVEIAGQKFHSIDPIEFNKLENSLNQLKQSLLVLKFIIKN